MDLQPNCVDGDINLSGPQKNRTSTVITAYFALILFTVWGMGVLYLFSQQHDDDMLQGRNLQRIRAVIQREKSDFHRSHQEKIGDIDVIFTTDENTLVGLMATINSIRLNTRHRVRYHILTVREAARDVRNWIEESVLQNIDYDVKIFDTKLVEGKIAIREGRPELGKPMNYARYFYPDIYPHIQGKFIHMDDDIIVKGDIAELIRTKLQPDHLAAFSDDCNPIASQFKVLTDTTFDKYLNFDNPKISGLGLSRSACSFNTGLMIGHMGRWRKENVTVKLTSWLQLNKQKHIYGNKQGGGGSQPPMMLVFYNRYAQIDPMWHLQHLGGQAGFKYPYSLIKSAKLLHWNGPNKPWKTGRRLSQIWDQYYVPYKNYKLPKKER